jgi:hypothetical protein
MKSALAIFFIAATLCQPVRADEWYLRIEVPQGRSPPSKPTVTVADRPSTPRFDSSSGRWLVPLDTTGSNFVIPYVVDGLGNDVVAVRIDVPTRIVREHQTIFLGPPSLKSVDERSIREFWSNNQITREPSNIKLQFHYLQDLLHANRTLMERQANPSASTINATNLRSSYMLLQVVINLAQHTWYVVDPNSEALIDWAEGVVHTGYGEGRTCGWLSVCKKKGIPSLLGTVRSIDSQRLNRMYAALVPDGTELNTDFCDTDRLASLNSFFDYFRASSEQGATRVGVNESRVVNDIAACHAVRALCSPESSEASVRELESAEHLLLRVDQSASTKSRLREIRNALTGLRNGQPARCPTPS